MPDVNLPSQHCWSPTLADIRRSLEAKHRVSKMGQYRRFYAYAGYPLLATGSRVSRQHSTGSGGLIQADPNCENR